MNCSLQKVWSFMLLADECDICDSQEIEGRFRVRGFRAFVFVTFMIPVFMSFRGTIAFAVEIDQLLGLGCMP